jgi:hypothetical protein
MDICATIPSLSGRTRFKLENGLPPVSKPELAVATDTSGKGYVCLLLPYTGLFSILPQLEANDQWMNWLYQMPCIVSVCGYKSGRGINDRNMIHLISWICRMKLKLRSFWATGNQLESMDPFKILYNNKCFSSNSHLHLSEGQMNPSNVLEFLIWLTTIDRKFALIRLTGNLGVAFFLSSNNSKIPTIALSDSRPLDNTKLVNFVQIDQNKTRVVDNRYQQANLFIPASLKIAFDAEEVSRPSITLGDYFVMRKQTQSSTKKQKKAARSRAESTSQSDYAVSADTDSRFVLIERMQKNCSISHSDSHEDYHEFDDFTTHTPSSSSSSVMTWASRLTSQKV